MKKIGRLLLLSVLLGNLAIAEESYEEKRVNESRWVNGTEQSSEIKHRPNFFEKIEKIYENLKRFQARIHRIKELMDLIIGGNYKNLSKE